MTAPQFALDFHDAERDIARCAAIARELAWKEGAKGITMHDVREAAVTAGVITGKEQGRRLSFLGRVPAAAKLVATGERRYSPTRNPNMVFVLPEFAERSA